MLLDQFVIEYFPVILAKMYGWNFETQYYIPHENCDCKPPAYSSIFRLRNRFLEPAG